MGRYKGITTLKTAGLMILAELWPFVGVNCCWNASQEIRLNEQQQAEATQVAVFETEQARNNGQDEDLINLYATQGALRATQRAQGEDIDNLENVLTGTPTLPKPSDIPTPTPDKTPTRPYETPKPSPSPTTYGTPSATATDIPTQPATPTPDNLSRLIEYARNLPRARDLPPQENRQDRDEGLYLRAFKVFEENGRFRHEEISDSTEVDSTSLENHKIRSGTRDYWTVITAGKTFNSDIDMYDEPGVLVNPSSLETVLILRPDTNINTGLFSVHASGLRPDGTRVSYAEMIRAVADTSN